jgi:hypothetical protein
MGDAGEGVAGLTREALNLMTKGNNNLQLFSCWIDYSQYCSGCRMRLYRS